MTWAEFKKEVEAGGVTDEMELWYIDVSATGIHGPVTVSPSEENQPGFVIGFTVSE